LWWWAWYIHDPSIKIQDLKKPKIKKSPPLQTPNNVV